MSQDRMQDNSSRQIPIDQEQTTSNPPVEFKIPQKPSGKIRVSHGANEQYFDGLTGKTVGKIRKSLKEVFNIPSDAAALVDGKEVDAEFILQPNQHLEFYKESGTKGRIGIIPYFLVVVYFCLIALCTRQTLISLLTFKFIHALVSGILVVFWIHLFCLNAKVINEDEQSCDL